ncbi:MAG TPA: acyl-CoA dehydrogenase family protein [Blastocatellia bacterium]|nr:acyl-CoA dehydrogenase family protein [Blastocatellia bacterium]
MAELKHFRGTEGADFFAEDRGFQTILASLLPTRDTGSLFASLHEFGRLAGGPWNELAQQASRHENLPRIVKTDRVGNPVERVDFGPLTRQLRREVAERGVLSRAQSEIHKFSIVYLLAHNGEASLTCGLSCTDGLERAVQAKGSTFLRDTYLPRLLSTETPFAGAQFVTERAGGSDVGAIEMTAHDNGDGTWSVAGDKWFCSNPDEYYLVAAKLEGAPAGTRGIGVFFVPRALPDERPNSLAFVRLKNKLGTQSLPTAEIEFRGSIAYPIGEPSEGFKTLMNYVINTSRVHNAVNACGIVHRAFVEARNYARQREAFGARLVSYPLIQETLIAMQETIWRNRLLTFRLISLLDQHGLVPDDEDQAMWQRFLINLAKYRTACTSTMLVREAITVLGANGIEEEFSVLPRLLRDAMIMETWEGPHNTLCLQIVRDAGRSRLLERWQAEIGESLERWPRGFLSYTRNRFEQSLRETEDIIAGGRITEPRWAETHARRLVDRMGSLLEIAWMAELSAKLSGKDWTPALLTAMARYRLFPTDRLVDTHLAEAITESADALIEESPLASDVTQL